MINGKVRNYSPLRAIYHTFLVLSSLFFLSLAYAGDYDKERDMVVPLLETYQYPKGQQLVEREIAACTAVRVSPSQYLTAAHCVGFMENEKGQKVPNFKVKPKYLVNGEQKQLELEKIDYTLDLALLHTPDHRPDVGPVAKITIKKVPLDAPVFAVGYPVADDIGNTKVLTFGNNQGLTNATSVEGLFYLFTAPIAPGNSGGPLFTIDGDLIGIITRQADYGDGFFTPYQRVWHLNLAVSSESIVEFLAK